MNTIITDNIGYRINDRRLANSFGFALCGLILVFAYFLQSYLDLHPCPLCVFQRLIMAALGGIFLLAMLHAPRRWGTRIYATLIAVVAGIGASVAGYHVWLQSSTHQRAPICIPPLDYLLTSFPLPEVMQMLLNSPGDCNSIELTLFSLSIPLWALLTFCGLGVLGAASNWMRKKY